MIPSVSDSKRGGAMRVIPAKSDSRRSRNAVRRKASPWMNHLMATFASMHRSAIITSRHACAAHPRLHQIPLPTTLRPCHTQLTKPPVSPSALAATAPQSFLQLARQAAQCSIADRCRRPVVNVPREEVGSPVPPIVLSLRYLPLGFVSAIRLNMICVDGSHACCHGSASHG